MMCHNGQGVPKDSVLAYAWFNLAAAQGDEFNAEKVRDSIPLSSAISTLHVQVKSLDSLPASTL